MPSIGSFKVSRAETEADPFTFDLEDETFTVSSKVGIMPLADFIEAAQSGLDTATESGIVAMKNLLRDVVIDDDQDRLIATARKYRVNGDDLMPIVRAVWAALSERPTSEPSDSSDGSATTGTSSREPASSEEPSLPSWWDTEVAKRERMADPDWGNDFLSAQDNGKQLVS